MAAPPSTAAGPSSFLSRVSPFAAAAPPAPAALDRLSPRAAAAQLLASPRAAGPALAPLLARADARPGEWDERAVSVLADAVVAAIEAEPAAALEVHVGEGFGDGVVRLVVAVAVVFAWERRRRRAGKSRWWWSGAGELEKRVGRHVQGLVRAVAAVVDAFLRGESENALPDQLLLAVSSVAGVIAAELEVESRRLLARAFIHAAPRLRASALGLGAAAATVAPSAAEVVAELHALAADVGAGLKNQRLLVVSLGALAAPRFGEMLTAWDSLVALDVLGLLGMPVSYPAHPALVLLATLVAGDPRVLALLGELVVANVTPPLAPRARQVFLLYALVLSLSLAQTRGKREREAVARPGDSSVASSWMNSAAMLREQYMQEGSPRSVMHSVALDACVGLIASPACDRGVSTAIGTTLWDDLLVLFERGAVRPTDLARALDVMVSDAVEPGSAVACLQRLDAAVRLWARAEWRRVGVVLALRAALRCELRVLREVLDVVEMLVQREDAVETARDAVLSADAVRKATMLRWYFGMVQGQSDKTQEHGQVFAPSHPGALVAKL